jgi:hypothetical protein
LDKGRMAVKQGRNSLNDPGKINPVENTM